MELGTTDEHQSAEQDGTKLIPQTTQFALEDKRVQSPREVAQRVASIEDASSEMTAMASGPRPVEAPASSAVNHRGVTSLSPVSPKRVWMAGTSPSNQGDAASAGEPVTANTTGVPNTPDDIAKREEQISQLMAAMDESRAREERMSQMLHDMQQKLNATETQQELFSQKALKDQQDLQQANMRLEESLKLERERTAAMLKEPSPK